MGPMPGYTGTVYIDIGGYTLEIDWSKVGSDGVSFNFADNGIVVGDINLAEGNDGFWIDFPYGPGKGDIVSQSYKSIYVKGAKSSVFAHQGGQVQQDPGWDLNNDGTLSLSEANNWYRVGNGQPIAIPLSTLDLTSVHVVDFRKGVGSTKSFSLFINSSSYNDMLVFGSITLRLYPDNMVRAFSDRYDFDQRNGLNPLNWPRNAATAIGEWVAGDGIPFQIHLTGSAYITHESTRVNK